MTGQFEWPVTQTPPERKYTTFQVEHDQHPIWPHPGRVPGVRRPLRIEKKSNS